MKTQNVEQAPAKSPVSHFLAEMPPVLARGQVYLVALLLGVALAWASVSRVDVVVEADGSLRPRQDIVPIQAPLSGTVLKVLAEPGMRVTSGEVLMVLNSLPVRANVERLRHEAEVLDESTAHLTEALRHAREAMKTGAAPASDAYKRCPVERLVTLMNELARARDAVDAATVNLADVEGKTGLPPGVRTRETEEFRLKLEMKKADLAKARAGLVALEADLATSRQNLKVAQDLYATYEKLFRDSVVSRVEFLAQMQQLAQARSGLANVKSGILKAHKEIDQLGSEVRLLSDHVNKALIDANKHHALARTAVVNQVAVWDIELSEKAKRRAAVQRELEIASAQLARTEVRSPAAGVVDDVKVNQLGGIVGEGQVVMQLLVGASPLEAEVRFKNRDVGALRVGLEARVKVEAFPFNEWGFLKGKLRLVSIDAGKGDEYTGRVTLDPAGHLVGTDGRTAILRTGMSCEVEIIKEQRLVVDFLLKPFRGLAKRKISVQG